MAIRESFAKRPLNVANFAFGPISFVESVNGVLVHSLITADNLSAEPMHMITITDGFVGEFQEFDNTAATADSGKNR